MLLPEYFPTLSAMDNDKPNNLMLKQINILDRDFD